jgi:hypothetical protein
MELRKEKEMTTGLTDKFKGYLENISELSK